MRAELYNAASRCLKTTPSSAPPFRLCSIFIHSIARFGVYKHVIHPCVLHNHTRYAGISPVLFNTLYILPYNYSLNYTLTHS